MLLKAKTAVIYGGAAAIGGAVARVFARERARVFIAGRTQARLDVVAADIAAAGGTVGGAPRIADDRRSEAGTLRSRGLLVNALAHVPDRPGKRACPL